MNKTQHDEDETKTICVDHCEFKQKLDVIYGVIVGTPETPGILEKLREIEKDKLNKYKFNWQLSGAAIALTFAAAWDIIKNFILHIK